MTSRERIRAALDHRPVDRVPIDLGGTGQSGIATIAYGRLRNYLALPERSPKVSDLVQMLAEVDTDVLNRFGSDTVPLTGETGSFGMKRENWKPFALADGSTCLVPGGFTPELKPDGSLVVVQGGREIASMPKGGFYFDSLTKAPGAAGMDPESFQVWTYPDSYFQRMARESERLFNETDKAIVAWFGPPYELFYGMGQGDFEEWMVNFAGEPEYVEALYAKIIERWIENLEGLERAVGDRLHVLQFCDDLGTQSAPFLSVDMFREQVMPAYQRGIDWIHANTDWKVLMHTDGAIFPLIPSLIEMGVDALNPIQTTAAGMDLAAIKREFGDRIALWGASGDSQNNLTSGSPETVAAEVSHHLEILRPLEGGTVFASVHNIQATVPPENIVALFDTALNFSTIAQHPIHCPP